MTLIFENKDIAEDTFAFFVHYVAYFHAGNINEKERMKRYVKSILMGIFNFNYN